MSGWHEAWGQQRAIHLFSTVDQNLCGQTIQQLWGFAALSDEPVTLWINSEGGECHHALALIDAIAHCPVPVQALALGKCFSAGFLIYLAAPQRVALRHTLFMSHTFATQGGLWTNVSAVGTWLEERMIQHILAHTHAQTEQEVREVFLSSDYFFDAEEAVRLGVAQRIVTEKLEVIKCP